jgi:inosine-uridine nucleoside N-ribohydrolase
MKKLLFFFCALTVFSNAKGQMTPEPQKIIFDTDSAYFNDDGAALSILLHRPEVMIMGVTLVAGNYWIPQGAAYTLNVLDILQRTDVPVYFGETSSIREQKSLVSDYLEQKNQRSFDIGWLGALIQEEGEAITMPFGEQVPDLSRATPGAVDFIIETIKDNPDEVTILALGPMTNIAKAILKAPEIQTKIKSIVWMGGSVFEKGNSSPHAEFNFWFDPKSAMIVVQSTIPNKVMFGLDATNQAVLTKIEFDQVVAQDSLIKDIYANDHGHRYPGFYKNPEAKSYIWDALAAVYLFDPSFVLQMEKMHLKVDGSYSPTMGKVFHSKTKKDQFSEVSVATKLDHQKFFDLYVRALKIN